MAASQKLIGEPIDARDGTYGGNEGSLRMLLGRDA